MTAPYRNAMDHKYNPLIEKPLIGISLIEKSKMPDSYKGINPIDGAVPHTQLNQISYKAFHL